MTDISDIDKSASRPAMPPGEAGRPDYISENLKALYKTTAQEPLPDRFRELLERLAREERS